MSLCACVCVFFTPSQQKNKSAYAFNKRSMCKYMHVCETQQNTSQIDKVMWLVAPIFCTVWCPLWAIHWLPSQYSYRVIHAGEKNYVNLNFHYSKLFNVQISIRFEGEEFDWFRKITIDTKYMWFDLLNYSVEQILFLTIISYRRQYCQSWDHPSVHFIDMKS